MIYIKKGMVFVKRSSSGDVRALILENGTRYEELNAVFCIGDNWTDREVKFKLESHVGYKFEISLTVEEILTHPCSLARKYLKSWNSE